MPTPDVSYFFDLPVAEVSRSVCDALRLLYHGSLEGAFGKAINDRFDLDEARAIKIPILPSSAKTSDSHEYNLVYYSKELSGSLWNVEDRKKQAELRALTQRVSFNPEKTTLAKRTLAKRILNNLFVKSDPAVCPVYFAKYEALIPHDGCVPIEYHRKLMNRFEGYLMRCNRDFPLVRSLFRAQGIDLAKRRFARDENHHARPVITYTLKKMPAEPAPPVQPQSAFEPQPLGPV